MSSEGIQFPKFFVTAPSACPYIDGMEERKVFTDLEGPDAMALNEALGKIGFRRSQTVAYRPACEDCNACISVRSRALDFKPSKSMKRVATRNADIKSQVRPAITTVEQYDLLHKYLVGRHDDGSMTNMSHDDFREMVETSSVETVLIEYRRALDNKLMGVALTDQHSDGLSMVYSFFDIDENERSLGVYMILDHLKRTRIANQPYLYLGYWVKQSQKMSYKVRYQPIEALGAAGWRLMDKRECT